MLLTPQQSYDLRTSMCKNIIDFIKQNCFVLNDDCDVTVLLWLRCFVAFTILMCLFLLNRTCYTY